MTANNRQTGLGVARISKTENLTDRTEEGMKM
jgi:hypothetical protein